LEELLAKIIAHKVAIWLVVTTTISAAAAMAALSPPPKNDNSKIGKIRRVIDIFGWNFGFAKNNKK